MNAIRQTALLNKRELENATPPSASWHVDYRDTAWIYVGGLPLDLSEGDVCIIFSQFGNPTHLNLIRDKETGKSKGFGFLKYEDQRSCDLAVDNLGGSEVLGRMLRVDHSRYKKRDGEDEETYRVEARETEQLGIAGGEDGQDTDVEDGDGGRRKKRRKLLKEEVELQEMLAIKPDGEDEDPMRDYLIQEKKAEVEKAKAREMERRKQKHRHRHDADREHKEGDAAKKRHKHDADDDRRSKDRPRDNRNGDGHRRRDEKPGRERSRSRDGLHRRRRSPSRSKSRSLS